MDQKLSNKIEPKSYQHQIPKFADLVINHDAKEDNKCTIHDSPKFPPESYPQFEKIEDFSDKKLATFPDLDSKEKNEALKECKQIASIKGELIQVSFDQLPQDLDQRQEGLQEAKQKIEANEKILKKEIEETSCIVKMQAKILQNLDQNIYNEEDIKKVDELEAREEQLKHQIQSSCNVVELGSIANGLIDMNKETIEEYKKASNVAKEKLNHVAGCINHCEAKLTKSLSNTDYLKTQRLLSVSAKKTIRAPKHLEIPDFPVLDHINDQENNQILTSLKSIIGNKNKNNLSSIKNDFELTRDPEYFSLDDYQPKEESKQDLASSSEGFSSFPISNSEEAMKSNAKLQFNNEEIEDLQDLCKNFSELISQFVKDRDSINFEKPYLMPKEESKKESKNMITLELPKSIPCSEFIKIIQCISEILPTISKYEKFHDQVQEMERRMERMKNKRMHHKNSFWPGFGGGRRCREGRLQCLEENYQYTCKKERDIYNDLVQKIKTLELLLSSLKIPEEGLKDILVAIEETSSISEFQLEQVENIIKRIEACFQDRTKEIISDNQNMEMALENIFQSEMYSKQHLDAIQKQMVTFVKKITTLKNTKEKDKSSYMSLHKEYDDLYKKSAHLKEEYKELSLKFEQKETECDKISADFIQYIEKSTNFKKNNQKSISKFLKDTKTLAHDHNSKTTTYHQLTNKANNTNCSIIQSLKANINVQMQRKNDILKEATQILSTISSDLSTKSHNIALAQDSITSKLTNETQSKSLEINSLIQTHKKLAEQTSILQTEVSSFNDHIRSEYWNACRANYKTFCEANAKLLILHHIRQGHTQDCEGLKEHHKDLEAREKQQKEHSFKEVDYFGAKIVIKEVNEIADESASALILPVNERLSLNHLPKEFSTAIASGGEELIKACKVYIQQHANLKMGDAVMLPSGNLMFDKVIASYCPNHEEEAGQTRSVYFLRKTIERVLDLSIIHQLRSIIIPSFCSEESKFPPDLYSTIVVKTVKDYIKVHRRKMEDKRITICYFHFRDEHYFADVIDKEDLEFPVADSDQKFYTTQEEEIIGKFKAEIEQKDKDIDKAKSIFVRKQQKHADQILDLKREANAYKAEIRELKPQIEDLNEILKETNRKVEKNRKKISRKERTIESLQYENADLQKENEDLLKKYKNIKKECKALKAIPRAPRVPKKARKLQIEEKKEIEDSETESNVTEFILQEAGRHVVEDSDSSSDADLEGGQRETQSPGKF
ncbi:unnamed protein product [Moneuplotes crassus]|uniref:Macro domain-containing protein n=1 Tax=Euplotes crassus TaxID=5936 RepID=A0AAD1XTW9_EUPCR|nr:unnamed protein product [Moneuplotes crassus]